MLVDVSYNYKFAAAVAGMQQGMDAAVGMTGWLTT